jgi:protein SCO1
VTNRVTGITGDPVKVAAMVKSFGVYARKVPSDDGGYEMDHTASVFLLNSAGDFHGTIAYGENPDSALEKMRRLAKL